MTSVESSSPESPLRSIRGRFIATTASSNEHRRLTITTSGERIRASRSSRSALRRQRNLLLGEAHYDRFRTGVMADHHASPMSAPSSIISVKGIATRSAACSNGARPGVIASRRSSVLAAPSTSLSMMRNSKNSPVDQFRRRSARLRCPLGLATFVTLPLPRGRIAVIDGLDNFVQIRLIVRQISGSLFIFPRSTRNLIPGSQRRFPPSHHRVDY